MLNAAKNFFEKFGQFQRRISASLSIRFRLYLLFAALMILGSTFTLFVVYEDHSLTSQASNVAVDTYEDLRQAHELGVTLSDIHTDEVRTEISPEKLDRFQNQTELLRLREKDPESLDMLRRIEVDYQSYREKLLDLAQKKSPRALMQALAPEIYENVAASVAAFATMKEDRLYETTHLFRTHQDDLMRLGFGFLALFIVCLGIGAFRAISIVTSPLTALVRFLDGLDGGDTLPAELPEFQSNVTEVGHVARSFTRLLKRLKGYQALNLKRLLMEKRRTDVIAASIADGIFLLRGDEILYLNPVAERLLGLPAGLSSKGLILSQFVESSADKKQKAGAVAVLNAVSRTMPVDFAVESRDQRKSYYLLQAYPISSEIIEQVEHTFAGPADQLFDRWQATTMVLAQDVTIVRESQDAKSHFIATLSHEVKTPVTSLTMATRLLKKSIAQFQSPTHRALIETCADDVDRLRVLIEDLLSVSRFDTLTQKMELKNVDIGKLIKQSVQFFQPQAFEKGVEIAMTVISGGRPIIVPVDATKISWAISNLMTNALRHTPAGGRVETTVELRDEVVEVHIRDHGPGIDRVRQDRIFDKFNPFYDLRVARSGTVGMGLAIAREIVVGHGGRIWVTSEPGQGAEFCFTLPLRTSVVDSGLGMVTSQLKGDQNGTAARS